MLFVNLFINCLVDGKIYLFINCLVAGKCLSSFNVLNFFLQTFTSYEPFQSCNII